MPRSRAAPLRAAGYAVCSSCSRRFQRARGELLERMGSHSSRAEPRATLAWRHAMTMARARTNRHERAAAARLPPTPLAKLLRGMSRVCLTRCSVHQPRCCVPWRLATADTTPASTAGSSKQWSSSCLSPAALVRVQARDSCPAGGRATRASTSVWLVDRCQPVWTVTAGLEGMTWRSAGRRAACWLLSLSRCLAVTTTLATPYIPATQCF